MTANRSVDELNLRLAAIQDALLDLPPGPSPERYALLKEQDALRAEAAAHHISADEQRSTDELEAELTSLKQQRRRIVDAGTGFATGKGGSNQGPSAGAWVQLGTQARSGGDIGRLNARIARLEDLLAARHHEPTVTRPGHLSIRGLSGPRFAGDRTGPAVQDRAAGGMRRSRGRAAGCTRGCRGTVMGCWRTILLRARCIRSSTNWPQPKDALQGERHLRQ